MIQFAYFFHRPVISYFLFHQEMISAKILVQHHIQKQSLLGFYFEEIDRRIIQERQVLIKVGIEYHAKSIDRSF